jgi:carbonic anhydrase/acetyltransferase-like protein (isoleucine patch superfamily)
MTKYELLPSDLPGLYRIRALRDFGDVRAGDIGGYVGGGLNLSHDGNAWIYGDAQVYGNAWIYGDAQVFGYARVSDNAHVSGYARVYGNAWVSGSAHVAGDAHVSDDARVYGNARVFGCAQVYDYARVYGCARVYGNAWIYGDAHVHGDAHVCSDARVCDDTSICWFSHVGSESGTLTAFATERGIYCTRGCFEGTLDAFAAAVRETHGESQIAQEYALLIEFIRLRLGL